MAILSLSVNAFFDVKTDQQQIFKKTGTNITINNNNNNITNYIFNGSINNFTTYIYTNNSVSHGEIWIYNDTGYLFQINANDVYYNLTEVEIGEYRNINISNGYFTIQQEGIYKIDTTLSFSGSGGSTHSAAVFKNDIKQEDCYIRRKLGAGGDVGNMGDSCLLNLSVGDVVNYRIEDEDPAPAPANDITIISFDMNMMRLGGIDERNITIDNYIYTNYSFNASDGISNVEIKNNFKLNLLAGYGMSVVQTNTTFLFNFSLDLTPYNQTPYFLWENGTNEVYLKYPKNVNLFNYNLTADWINASLNCFNVKNSASDLCTITDTDTNNYSISAVFTKTGLNITLNITRNDGNWFTAWVLDTNTYNTTQQMIDAVNTTGLLINWSKYDVNYWNKTTNELRPSESETIASGEGSESFPDYHFIHDNSSGMRKKAVGIDTDSIYMSVEGKDTIDIEQTNTIFGDANAITDNTLYFKYYTNDPTIQWGTRFIMTRYVKAGADVGVNMTGNRMPTSDKTFNEGWWNGRAFGDGVFDSYGDYDNGVVPIVFNILGTPDQWRITYPTARYNNSYSIVGLSRDCLINIIYLEKPYTAKLHIHPTETLRNPSYAQGEVTYILFDQFGVELPYPSTFNNFNALTMYYPVIGIPLECFFVNAQVDMGDASMVLG